MGNEIEVIKTADGGEVHIIPVPAKFRPKYVPLKGRDAAIDPVARAEEALSRLAVNFENWLAEEVSTLLARWGELAGAKKRDAAMFDALYLAAHNLKGEAATFQYPTISKLAGNICTILENLDDREKALGLLEKHVVAIKAAFREKARDDSNETAVALIEELTAMVADKVGLPESGKPQDVRDKKE